MSFTEDFKSANTDFKQFHDELLKHVKGDKIIDIETMNNEIAHLFDQYSGIDAIQVVKGQLRTIALRVQWGKDWGTFTIRYLRKSGHDTEYKKRITAIYGDKGYLYPYLTVQAYLDKRDDAKKILNCCIVKTKDLYDYIRSNISTIKKNTCYEGNTFLIVSFKELTEAKVNNIVFGENIK